MLVIDAAGAAVRDVLHRFPGKEGFHMVNASGGEEGLRLARELHPNAIILDVTMPDMDGWALLSALNGQGVKREGDQCPGYSWSKITR